MDAPFSELLRRAKAGDPASLGELHARFQRRVAGLVRRRIGGALRRRCDTADLVQSVFEDVLRDLPEFEDRGEEAFRGWLQLKAENKVRDAWRRVFRGDGTPREDALASREEAVLDRGPGPATEAGDLDERLQVADAVAALPAAQREVLTLRDREGLPFARIADRLGLASADAARMRYARALIALRREWRGE